MGSASRVSRGQLLRADLVALHSQNEKLKKVLVEIQSIVEPSMYAPHAEREEHREIARGLSFRIWRLCGGVLGECPDIPLR